MAARYLGVPIQGELVGLEVNTILRRHLHLSGTVLRRIKWLSDGIMVDGTTFREDVTFSVSADVNEDTYSAWRDLLMRKFSWADILPADMSGALDRLVGNYELTFTIDKQ